MKHIVLQLPGWLDSGPQHWQTLWEQAFGDEKVQQLDWINPLRGDWQIALQEYMWAAKERHAAQFPSEEPLKFVLVGHSLGCHLISTWASYSPYADWVSAAMLVAPPDLSDRSSLPAGLAPWSPPVLNALPFPSVVVSSDDDPYASVQASQAMVLAWGSEHHLIGSSGHINEASALGIWPEGRDILNRVMAKAQQRK